MENPIKTPEDMRSGKLPEIIGYYTERDKERREYFIKKTGNRRGKLEKTFQANETYYGYPVKADHRELEEAFIPYQKYIDYDSDFWMLEDGGFYSPESLADLDIAQELQEYPPIVRLLTGMQRVAGHPSGSCYFLSTLPNDWGTTEMIHFDHKTGQTDQSWGRTYSIAEFVASTWYRQFDHDARKDRLYTSPEVWTTVEEFRSSCEKLRETKRVHEDGAALFRRSWWLMGHAANRPTFHYSRAMSFAPAFDVYLDERERLTSQPVLANYWMLAHFFLGNRQACRESVELVLNAGKSPDSTRSLAELVAAGLQSMEENPTNAALGLLAGEPLTDLLAETRRMIRPDMLEPEGQAALTAERGDRPPQLSDVEITRALEAGALPLELIQKHPDDVEAHDQLLQKMVEADESLSDPLSSYFSERKDPADNNWPRKGRDDEDFDPRLSLPIAAGFRAGLKYDEEFAISFTGVTKSLGVFDDDHAMDAYQDALQTLKPSDPRLKQIVANLNISKHPRRNELIFQGAWRLFELLDLARKTEADQDARRKKEGLTLDNIWDARNHFLAFIRLALKQGGPETVSLAKRIIQENDAKAFKHSFGDALRILADAGHSETSEICARIVNSIAGLDVETDTFIDGPTLYVLVEAGIAWSKLEPESALPRALELFERKTKARRYDLDLKAALIYPLLAGNSDDEYLRNWLLRLLGNQEIIPRLFGPFRAAAELKRTDLLEDIRRFYYADINHGRAEQKLITEVARQSCLELGMPPENLPEFPDNFDYHYCLELSPEEIPEAFKQPEKYYPDDLCKRIVEKKIVSPEARDAVTVYLTRLLRFSEDTCENYWPKGVSLAMEALHLQGMEALPIFMDLLKLPDSYPYMFQDIMSNLGNIEPEVSLRQWLYGAAKTELFQELAAPSARFLPWLALIGARLLVLEEASPAAVDAVVGALKERLKFISDHYNEEEPSLVGLGRLAVACGRPEVLQEKLDEIQDRYWDIESVLEELLEFETYDFSEDDFAWKSGESLHISNAFKVDDGEEPLYGLLLSRNGNKIQFACQEEDVSIQKTIPTEVTTKNEKDALRLGEEILRESAYLGYEPYEDDDEDE